jgi:hypothetical protein
MRSDTLSVKYRGDAHPCVTRNSISFSRKHAYVPSLRSAVRNVCASMRHQRHEPGRKLLGGPINTFKTPKYSNRLLFALLVMANRWRISSRSEERDGMVSSLPLVC